MIGVVYNDTGSTATLEELAEKHGILKRQASAINKRFLNNLWNNSPPSIQERYPLNEILSARKPWSQSSRESASRRMGGASLEIKGQVLSGVRDIDTISKNIGIPPRAVSNFSGRLREWGIDVPKKYASHKEDLKQLENEGDDEKIQELLDRIPLHVVRHDIAKKKEASQFPSLSPLVREAGFRLHSPDTHFFATSLKSAGVPITIKEKVVKGAKPRTLPYYIMLSRHKR